MKRICKALGMLAGLVLLAGLLILPAQAAETEITEIEGVVSNELVPCAGLEVRRFSPNVPDGAPYSRYYSGSVWVDDQGVEITHPEGGWFDIGYEFEAGRTYTTELQYEAAAGYIFAENPAVSLTLGGDDLPEVTTEVIERWDNGKGIVVRYTMTLPGQRDYPNINKVSLGSFDQPSEGSKPESASLIYNNCTLTRQEWNTGTWGSQATWGVYEHDDSGEKCFVAGETYVQMIELTAHDNYQFAENVLIQKGTQSAEKAGEVTLSPDRKVATVTFTYPIAEYEIIQTVELVAANQHVGFCLRSGESIYLPQPFISKYALAADCLYQADGGSNYEWFNDETGGRLPLGYSHSFEAGKTYTLKFSVRIEDEYQTTHKFANDVGLNIENYQYSRSDFVEYKVYGGGATVAVEVTYTAQFPEGQGSTASNPVWCSSYAEFKYAMENDDIRYVALGNVEDMLPSIPHDEEQDPGGITTTAIVVRGTKDLNLLGNAVFRCPLTENYDLKYYIQLLTLTEAADSSLYIHGPGSLTYVGGTLDFVNSVIKVEGGHLTVDGTTVRGSNGYHTGFCYGINAIFGSVAIQGGATIRGGVYEGHGVRALVVGSEGVTRSLSVSIWDGNFYVDRDIEGGYTVDGEYIPYVDYGISVQNDVGLRIYGMITDGIELDRYAADNLGAYVQDGCVMAVNGVKTDPATCGTIDGKVVEVYQEISEVDIHINTPVAGEAPTIYAEDVYEVPLGCAVTGDLVWYEDGQPWNLSSGSARFEAGKSYKVEIALSADDGVKFANPLTSATINYETATVSALSGNIETGIILSLDFGACPDTVGAVALTIDAPAQHATPDQRVTCGHGTYKQALTGDNMFDQDIQWQESDTGADDTWEIMEATDTFTVGRYYRAFIDLMPTTGHQFAIDYNIDPDVSATVNGYSAKVSRYPEADPQTLICVCYDFGLLNDNIIEQIDIDGVTEPVVGEKPDYSCAISGTGYSISTAADNGTYCINGICWRDMTDDKWVYPTDTFEIGHQYKVFVDVKTEDGYEFYTSGNSYVPEGWGYINDNSATLGRQSDARYEQTLSWTFACAPRKINQVDISDLTMPRAGAKPDFTAAVGEPDYYRVDFVEWYDDDAELMTESDTFVEGDYYRIRIRVVPVEVDGQQVCKFVEDKTVATVNGLAVKQGNHGWDEVVSGPNAVTIFYSYDCLSLQTGDVNGSGIIDQRDVTALQRYIVNPIAYPVTANGFAAADLNGDGKVDAKDILLLRRMVEGV